MTGSSKSCLYRKTTLNRSYALVRASISQLDLQQRRPRLRAEKPDLTKRCTDCSRTRFGPIKIQPAPPLDLVILFVCSSATR